MLVLAFGTAAQAQPFGINVQSPPYNAACNGTTDDSSALNSAVGAANSSGINAVYIPPGCRLGLNATQITLGTVKLSGTGPMDVGGALGGTGSSYGTTASQVWLRNPTNAPFILESGAAIENISFWWPNQTEGTAAKTYMVTVTGSTRSGQTDSVKVTGFGQMVTVSIPQNTSAAAAALLIAQAVNGNSIISGNGAYAAADGGVSGYVSLTAPTGTPSWSVTTGALITLSLSTSAGYPVAYPPLFLNNQSVQINRFDFINSQVTNAFDFLAQIGTGSQAPAPIGQAHILGSQIYAVNNALTLTNQPETFKIADTFFSFGTYLPTTLGPTYYLWNWRATNGSWLNVVNGTTAQPIVQSLLTSHVFIFGYSKTVWVSTGHLDISNLDFSVDGVQSVLEVDSAGQITNTTFTGASSGFWSILCSQSPLPPASCSGVNSNPAIWVNTPTASAGASLYFKNIFIDVVHGDLFRFVAAPNAGIVTEIENVTVNGGGPASGSATMIYYNGTGTSGGSLIARNNAIYATYGNSSVSGIAIGNTGSIFADITGNELFSFSTAISLGSSATPTLVEGNTTHFSGTASITAGTGSVAVLSGNFFDKVPTPSPSACGTSPSVSANDNGVGTVTFGGGSPSSCTLPFAIPFGRTPRCTLTPHTAGITAYLSSSSTTAITIGLSAATSGAVIDYVCAG